MPRTWTHKVVKKSRGMQGEWFSHRAALTGTLAECERYAEQFRDEQVAVLGRTDGHRIVVVARKGNAVAKTYRYAN